MGEISIQTMPSGGFLGEFTAMESECSVLIDSNDRELAIQLTTTAYNEVLRVEAKTSDSNDSNLINTINNAQGAITPVDEEFAQLLDYAAKAFELSEGKFDITSAVLSQLWDFNGSGSLPSQDSIDEALTQVGWQKVRWKAPFFSMPTDMKIDLGGIAKAYAVDTTAELLVEQTSAPVLINFGGDMVAINAPPQGHWTVGVQSDHAEDIMIQIKRGALATCGDTQRYVLHEGKRYCSVLDATTGWQPSGAPYSVTVAAASCVQAGMMATISLLQGEAAEAYLKELDVSYWLQA